MTQIAELHLGRVTDIKGVERALTEVEAKINLLVKEVALEPVVVEASEPIAHGHETEDVVGLQNSLEEIDEVQGELQTQITAEGVARTAADAEESVIRAAADAIIQADVNAHEARVDNPHAVTAAQVGASPVGHDHDSRYYTETEADALFLTSAEADALFLTPAEGNVLYAPLVHTHAAADITSGNLAYARMPTGTGTWDTGGGTTLTLARHLTVSGTTTLDTLVVDDPVHLSAGVFNIPSLTGPDINSGVWFPATNEIAFSTASLERFRIKSKNFGFWTSDIEAWASWYGAFQFGIRSAIAARTDTGGLFLYDNIYNNGAPKYRVSSIGAAVYSISGTAAGGQHVFEVAVSGTIDTTATLLEILRMDYNTELRIGFLGATQVGKQAVGAAATDLATVLTLSNNIRTAGINFGLLKT